MRRRPNPDVDRRHPRTRNLPLLQKLTLTDGACAIVARDGEDVIATLRFYPRSLCRFGDESGAGFCLQQAFPMGPADALAAGPPPIPPPTAT